jgi:hypothetical protein
VLLEGLGGMLCASVCRFGETCCSRYKIWMVYSRTFRGLVKAKGRGIARIVVFVNMKWFVLANAETSGHQRRSG